MKPRVALALLVLLCTVSCDQASKHWARVSLSERPLSLVGDHVRLELAENRGAFLSLGANLDPAFRTLLLTVCVGVLVGFGIFWLFAQQHPVFQTICGALILGGGIGNLIDRSFRSGAVTDFIFLSYGPLHTGVFNVADVAITFGVLALFLGTLRGSRGASIAR